MIDPYFEEEQSGSGILPVNPSAPNFIRKRKDPKINSLFGQQASDNDIMKVDFYSSEPDQVTVYNTTSLKIHPNEASYLSRLESDTGK